MNARTPRLAHTSLPRFLFTAVLQNTLTYFKTQTYDGFCLQEPKNTRQMADAL